VDGFRGSELTVQDLRVILGLTEVERPALMVRNLAGLGVVRIDDIHPRWGYDHLHEREIPSPIGKEYVTIHGRTPRFVGFAIDGKGLFLVGECKFGGISTTPAPSWGQFGRDYRDESDLSYVITGRLFVSPKDPAANAALMALPRQRSWGSVVEDFVRYKGRKYTFGPDGRAIRRHVLVRKQNFVPLGKEANLFEYARALGPHAVGGWAKRYVDPDPFNGSATEVARRLGVSRRTVFNRRQQDRTRESL
jgi:hypothetical protein